MPNHLLSLDWEMHVRISSSMLLDSRGSLLSQWSSQVARDQDRISPCRRQADLCVADAKALESQAPRCLALNAATCRTTLAMLKHASMTKSFPTQATKQRDQSKLSASQRRVSMHACNFATCSTCVRVLHHCHVSQLSNM